MFFRVVILVFAATFCTARVIDVSDKQSAWERSGKFEGDIVLTEEDIRNGLLNPATPWPNNEDKDDVFNVSDKQSAWERSGQFEGDIMLTDEQKRNGVINPARRWPSRSVPFFIDRVFTAAEQDTIMASVNEFHTRTTITLVRHNSPPRGDYIHITGLNSGCWSFVGRLRRGRQDLNLQRNGCLWNGIIIHEFLHALGFYHQHSATERDDYVTIHWQNIQDGREHNFQIQNARTITSFGVPYDYDSVMHYGPFAFSRNGNRTITPTDANATIGQRAGFSEKDILKLDLMYENSPSATRSPFITLIIVTLLVLKRLQ